jgi:hypothetical protein
MAHATHRIITNEGPKEVVTLYRVGLYAVHRGDNGYVVTHLPTGFRASSFRFLYLARMYADLMHQRAGDAGRSCEFGRAPRLGDGDRLTAAHNSAIRRMKSLYDKGD